MLELPCQTARAGVFSNFKSTLNDYLNPVAQSTTLLRECLKHKTLAQGTPNFKALDGLVFSTKSNNLPFVILYITDKSPPKFIRGHVQLLDFS